MVLDICQANDFARQMPFACQRSKNETLQYIFRKLAMTVGIIIVIIIIFSLEVMSSIQALAIEIDVRELFLFQYQWLEK